MRARDVLAALAGALAIACIFSACRREERRLSGLPGPYGDNAWAMSEGQRLFAQMNCSGCHSHGGGGMGVPLMDGKWRYGADETSIFHSIVDGRPNGMPSFRSRLGDDQAWQLAAYVRSLSGRASKNAAAVRDDHMAVSPGPARTEPEPITKDEP